MFKLVQGHSNLNFPSFSSVTEYFVPPTPAPPVWKKKKKTSFFKQWWADLACGPQLFGLTKWVYSVIPYILASSAGLHLPEALALTAPLFLLPLGVASLVPPQYTITRKGHPGQASGQVHACHSKHSLCSSASTPPVRISKNTCFAANGRRQKHTWTQAWGETGVSLTPHPPEIKRGLPV